MNSSTYSASSCVPATQLLDRLERGDRLAVGVARRHVVGVGDRDHPRERRDVRSFSPAVALAVDPLVVGEDDLAHGP